MKKFLSIIFLAPTLLFAEYNENFIDTDLKLIPKYKEIKGFSTEEEDGSWSSLPRGMFKGQDRYSNSGMSKTAGKKIYEVFVQNKNRLEKYPDRMLYAMGYFEVYFNNQLKKSQRSLKAVNNGKMNKFHNNKIISLLSLVEARATMLDVIGLDTQANSYEAIRRYFYLGDYLSLSKIEKTNISKKEIKFINKYKKVNNNLLFLEKLILKNNEQKFSEKYFFKEINKIINEINKNLLKLEKDKFYIENYSNKEIFNFNIINYTNIIVDIFKEKINTDDKKFNKISYKYYGYDYDELRNILSKIKFLNYNFSKINKILKKQYIATNANINDLKIFYNPNNKFDPHEHDYNAALKVISIILNSSKKSKLKKNKENFLNIISLHNQKDIDVGKYIINLNKEGIETKEIPLSFSNIQNIKDLGAEDWSNAYINKVPNEIYDDKGVLIQTLDDKALNDLRAQLAISSIDFEYLNNTNFSKDLSNSISEGINNISFETSLDKFDKFYITLGLDSFQQAVDIWNESYDISFSRDQWVSAIEDISENQELENMINHVDLSGIDFEAGQMARNLSMSLQDVADTIANAISAGISVDLEATAKGLGYDSFADAVAAYNSENGTNYTEQEAREALE